MWVLVDKEGGIAGFKVWGIHKIEEGEVVDVALTPVDLPQTRPEPAAIV